MAMQIKADASKVRQQQEQVRAQKSNWQEIEADASSLWPAVIQDEQRQQGPGTQHRTPAPLCSPPHQCTYTNVRRVLSRICSGELVTPA